jgi:hypothetical protein
MDETVLLIDVGNGSIGAGLVVFSKNKIPKSIYNVRLPFSILEKIDASKLESGMGLLLDDVLGNMSKFIPPNLSSVLVTFSSPWFISKTKHIHTEQDKPFVVTKGFFEQIVKKEEDAFKKELTDQAFTVVERNIVHTKVNGYSVQNSVGKKAKSFDAFLCMSVIGDSIVEKVHSLVSRYMHIRKERVVLHTFPLVSFSVVRDLYPNVMDFLLMDITSEVTDLTLVRGDVIIDTVSYPSGRNFIVRQVAKAFDVSAEIAVSLLHMCTEGKADVAVLTKMQELLVSVEKEWSVYMEDALISLSKEVVLPSRVYVTVESDVAPIFIKFFKKNIDVVYISHDLLSGLYQNNIKSPPDEFLAILSIFYTKIMQHRVAN